MNCDDVKNDLYFYIKNDIDLPTKKSIEEHIEKCSVCKELLNEFSKTLRVVDKCYVKVPSKNWDYFAEKTMDKIHVKRIYGFLRPTIGFMACVLIFAFSYRYYQLQKLQTITYVPSTEETVSYLVDFDIPELNE
ncbi:MAG: hypothetical protein A2474_00065 [Elusimicrobia bacterium RIFOXYC2_FULL_34_12]|nr:MAG: hypothetical protein A2474_00065 [Elusimicrobia bacterium RIFOXYC2_FULL_34_12]